MNKRPDAFKSLITFSITVLVLLSLACTVASPAAPDTKSGQSPDSAQVSFQRLVETKPYMGSRSAIIYTLEYVAAGANDKVAEKIVRMFGENNLSLDVSVLPEIQGKQTYQAAYLRDYINAGIIDLNVYLNAESLSESQQSTNGIQNTSAAVRLTNYREQFKNYFDIYPLACLISPDININDSCSLLQQAGFKLMAATDVKNNGQIFKKYNCDGTADGNGMYFLPVTGNVAEFDAAGDKWGDVYQPDTNNKLITAINNSLNSLGIAVLEISPEAFLTGDRTIDTAKLDKLENLVEFTKDIAEITTFNSWYNYAEKAVSAGLYSRKNDTPAYHGGPAIIFRLDDCLEGWKEETVIRIIKIFQQNDMVLDCGVIPYNNGEESFEVPVLRQYLDDGVIDVTMHGYDWTWAQLDTSKSGIPYPQLVNRLKASKANIENYYGVDVVSFTVPNDFFDQSGYDAVQNAGFKIFGTQTEVEPHPSLAPVNYDGKPDEKGMYRLPTATDVTIWDENAKNWGAVFDLSHFSGSKYYPVLTQYSYQREEPDMSYYSDFYIMVTNELNTLGIAVVGIHPDAFAAKNDKPDEKKLAQLEKLVQWCKAYTGNTTFRQWYLYTIGKK